LVGGGRVLFGQVFTRKMSPAWAHAGHWAAKENGKRGRLGELGRKEEMAWRSGWLGCSGVSSATHRKR
jgi:hypothetical protein